jgi:hypothetical protein
VPLAKHLPVGVFGSDQRCLINSAMFLMTIGVSGPIRISATWVSLNGANAGGRFSLNRKEQLFFIENLSSISFGSQGASRAQWFGDPQSGEDQAISVLSMT